MTNKQRGRPPYDDVLTPAEWRVVHAAQHGLSNRQIAESFGVSLDAVKYHIANAVAKLGVENKQSLKHWFATPKSSALSNQENPMDTTTLLNGVGQISRSVKDIQQAEIWYREVLGLPHLFTHGNLAFFNCGDVRLFLNQADTEPTTESIIYFRVNDIQKTYNELSTKGIEFISAPHMIHQHEDGSEEWMAFFNDLEGRPLAIMSTVGSDS